MGDTRSPETINDGGKSNSEIHELYNFNSNAPDAPLFWSSARPGETHADA